MRAAAADRYTCKSFSNDKVTAAAAAAGLGVGTHGRWEVRGKAAGHLLGEGPWVS